MRRAKANAQVPTRYYRPEQTTCPTCGHPLRRCYPLWRKFIVFLTGRYRVVSVGYRCSNPRCKTQSQVYASQAAQRLTLRGSSFALELIVQIGDWRFRQCWTLAQIHQALIQDRHVPISERRVFDLIGIFLVLWQCTYHQRIEAHAPYFRRHGLFLAIDALKPEKGNQGLYVVRDLTFGLVLHQVSLLSATQAALEKQLLAPVEAFGYRVRGVVSDDEKALALAIAHRWPKAQHQTCQFHCLRDAAVPISAADLTFKKQLKKAIRGPYYAVARAIDQCDPKAPGLSVLRTYADLLRTTLTEGSKPPFELGGLRVFADLTRLEISLKRCQKKRSIRSWPNSLPWSNAVNRFAAAIAGCNGNTGG